MLVQAYVKPTISHYMKRCSSTALLFQLRDEAGNARIEKGKSRYDLNIIMQTQRKNKNYIKGDLQLQNSPPRSLPDLHLPFQEHDHHQEDFPPEKSLHDSSAHLS